MSKTIKEIAKYLPLVAQMGISIVAPILLCVLLCMFLVTKAGVGTWVYIPGFILGIGGSVSTCLKVYRENTKDKEKRKQKIGFNDHV